VFVGLTAPQLESAALIAIGLLWLLAMARRDGMSSLRVSTA